MIDDQRSVSSHFSRAANAYANQAASQKGIAAKLSVMLPDYNPSKVLEIGCGTGFFTRELLERYPAAQITAIDLSSGMIAVSNELLGKNSQIEWRVADARTFQDGQQYDLIVGSSSLHWMTPLEELFSNLHAMLAVEGKLIFSLMLEKTLGELRELRDEIAPHKSPRASLLSISTVKSALKASGFSILEYEREVIQSHYPDAEAFFSTIRALGFTGGAVSTAELPLNRSEIRKLVSMYQERCSNGTRAVRASYEVGYFVSKQLADCS